LQNASESMPKYATLVRHPVEFAMYILNNLSKYEKQNIPLQPDVLNGVYPQRIAQLLNKRKSEIGRDDQQMINSWRAWRSGTWEVEGDNESKLRLLFRALLIFLRENDDLIDDNNKNKTKGCVNLIAGFLREVWGVDDPIKICREFAYVGAAKRYAWCSGMSNDWRDPTYGARQ